MSFFTRNASAGLQHVLDRIGVGKKRLAPLAGSDKMLHGRIAELLLRFAVTHAAGTIPLGQGRLLLGIGKQAIKREDRTGLRILGGFQRRRIGLDRHDLLAQLLGRFEDVDDVAVALRHLLTVRPRNFGRFEEHLGFRQMECLGAVNGVEPLCDVPSDFDMLNLIAADRHDVAVVQQDVGRHQHRVVEQSGIGGQSLLLLVLVGMTFFQQAHVCDGQQQPAELCDFRNIRLPKQCRPVRIESQRQQVDHGVQ